MTLSKSGGEVGCSLPCKLYPKTSEVPPMNQNRLSWYEKTTRNEKLLVRISMKRGEKGTIVLPGDPHYIHKPNSHTHCWLHNELHIAQLFSDFA